MTPRIDIENVWFLSKTDMVEDICKATGQEVTRILLESAKPNELVRIISKRLNPIFYDDLVQDFERFSGRLQVVVKNYDPTLAGTRFGQFLVQTSALRRLPSGSESRLKAERFMLVGDRAFRLCVRDKPFKAQSFIENKMIGRFLRKQFENVHDKSEQVKTTPNASEPMGTAILGIK